LAYVIAVNKRGDVVLHDADLSGSLELVKYLVEYLSTDYRYNDDLNSVLNAVDQNGETALHYAADLGSLELVIYLVHKGIEISTKNNWGQTAYDIAKEYYYLDITKYLSQLRAQSL
jgi:ankyrin repeat protein